MNASTGAPFVDTRRAFVRVTTPSAGPGDSIITSTRGSQRIAGRSADVAAFLESALGAGPIPVGELETKARTAGLLGEHQHVGDAKLFKAAKKRLGIVSRRDGFGREGA